MQNRDSKRNERRESIVGQLIKLQDYASRYEQNIFHYPSRFVTLKKQQWDKWQNLWKSPNEMTFLSQTSQNIKGEENEKHPYMKKIKSVFKRKKDIEFEEAFSQVHSELEKDQVNMFEAFPTFFHRAETMEELKQQFLNQLFDFQMKWATSTLMEKSFINKHFYYDEHLKFFLQRFPDTYLVLYQPILLLKKASIELETVLISPTDVWCISFLEQKDGSVFVGSNEKFWQVKNKDKEEKIISPMLALNRTTKIVKKIFQQHEVDLPVHKVLLSRNGFIDYPNAPYDVKLIEKRAFEEWFQLLRRLRSPLKHTQLNGAKTLLQYCQTTSIRRLEWEVIDKKQDD
jgi:uncharacterized Zn finger protein (UPF0148 family)